MQTSKLVLGLLILIMSDQARILSSKKQPSFTPQQKRVFLIQLKKMQPDLFAEYKKIKGARARKLQMGAMMMGAAAGGMLGGGSGGDGSGGGMGGAGTGLLLAGGAAMMMARKNQDEELKRIQKRLVPAQVQATLSSIEARQLFRTLGDAIVRIEDKLATLSDYAKTRMSKITAFMQSKG